MASHTPCLLTPVAYQPTLQLNPAARKVIKNNLWMIRINRLLFMEGLVSHRHRFFDCDMITRFICAIGASEHPYHFNNFGYFHML